MGSGSGTQTHRQHIGDRKDEPRSTENSGFHDGQR